MQMIGWLSRFLETDDTKLIYLLILIMIASLLDFGMGWINAFFNEDVTFSSSYARFGLILKIVYFIILIYFIPIALLLPDTLGIMALYTLYFGYLASELKSVFSHLSLTNDNKKNELFIDFIKKMIGSDK